MFNNKVIFFCWDRWTWKTMFATILAWAQKNLKFLCNYKINSCNCIKIESYDSLLNQLKQKKQQWNKERRVIILDESQKDLNSRSFTSKNNNKILQFIVESRKYSSDVIFIWQNFEWIDKQIREQADFVFQFLNYENRQKESNNDVNLWFIVKKRRLWNVNLKTQEEENFLSNFENIWNIWKINWIKVLQELKVSYNSEELVELF